MTNWFSWIGDVIFATMLRLALKCILRQNRQHTQKKHLLTLFCHFLLKTLVWKMFANLIPVFPLLRHNCKEKKVFFILSFKWRKEKKTSFQRKMNWSKNWGIISFQKKTFSSRFHFRRWNFFRVRFRIKEKNLGWILSRFVTVGFVTVTIFGHNILTLSRSCRCLWVKTISKCRNFTSSCSMPCRRLLCWVKATQLSKLEELL